VRFLYAFAAALTALSIVVLQTFRGIQIVGLVQDSIWVFVCAIVFFRATKYSRTFVAWLYIFLAFLLVGILSIIFNPDVSSQAYPYSKLAKIFIVWVYMYCVGYYLGESLLKALYKISYLWILATFIFAAIMSFDTIQIYSILHQIKSTYLPVGRSLSVAALTVLFGGQGRAVGKKIASNVLFFAAAITILTIDSKGPLFSVIFVAISANFMLQVLRRGSTRLSAYAMVATLLAFITVIGIYAYSDVGIATSGVVPNGISNSTSVRSRLQLYRHALDVFINRPVMGSGIGSYYAVLPSAVDGSYASQKTDVVYRYPHNIFFEAIAETGLMGFVWIALLLVYPIYNAYKVLYRHITDKKLINAYQIKYVTTSLALYINAVIISQFSSDISGNYWIALFAGVLLGQVKEFKTQYKNIGTAKGGY